MKVKEESEKAGLKLNFQKTKVMASGPKTMWQIDGVKMETVTDFIFPNPKITADSDCRHEIKRGMLLGRKAMTNQGSILESRDITFPKRSVKAIGFPGGSDSNASACSAGDPGSIPGLGRSSGEGNGNPLQYSCLENSMDWEAPQSLVGYSPWGRKELDMTEWL